MALVATSALASGAPAKGPMVASLQVDARDVARRLLTAQMDIPVAPGPMELNYVEWTPGNHNPSGPIQNVVDLVITDDLGDRLDWRRDPEKMTRLFLDIPDGAGVVTVRFSYITNQPSVISRSTDSYGFPTFGGLNWNTVLFYPGDVDKDDYLIEPELRLPGDWNIATSLAIESQRPGQILFKTVSLAELVDSPVIYGSTLRTYELQTNSASPHFIHAVAAFDELTDLGEERLQKFGKMVDQAEAVFGPFPREEYHFLVLLSDDLAGFGVEHNKSTYIAEPQDTFNDAEEKADPIGVIPHEYIHAWCGKLRTPAGLLATDYDTTGDTHLLWVYEGMTTYYADILAVRSGLMTEDEYVNSITNRIAEYELREGRTWRSVEDTAVALRFLRGRSASWGDRRRGVAYYAEGALFWMEADAIIRNGTRGEKSLDDFTRAFFHVTPGRPGSPVTYTLEDIVTGLRHVYPDQDWAGLVNERLEEPVKTLSLDYLTSKLGYELVFVDEPSEEQTKAIERNKGADVRYSLGLTTNKDGGVTRIVPDSLADKADLAYGMTILAVNHYTYTPERLRQAVARTPDTGAVTLLVEFGDKVEEKMLRYDGGAKYPKLVRRRGVDTLEGIMARR